MRKGRDCVRIGESEGVGLCVFVCMEFWDLEELKDQKERERERETCGSDMM